MNLENTYWTSEGKYQDLLDEATKQIPGMGECESRYLEAIRVTQNWYWDVYNNGGWNYCRSKDFVQDRLCEQIAPTLHRLTALYMGEDESGDSYGYLDDAEFLEALEKGMDSILLYWAQHQSVNN